MQPRDNTKDLIALLGGSEESPEANPLPCGWAWYAQRSFDYGYLVTAVGTGSAVRCTTKAEKLAKLTHEDHSPKEVLIFDNGGETWDRYTALFTGPYIHETAGVSLYIGMSAHPTDPQGFGQHGEVKGMVEKGDAHCFAHWGELINFSDLPEDCRAVVLHDYRDLWGLDDHYVIWVEPGGVTMGILAQTDAEAIQQAKNNPDLADANYDIYNGERRIHTNY
jgi:hypothetical protein